MGKKRSKGVDRRSFLAGIGAASAATVAVAAPGEAAQQPAAPVPTAARARQLAQAETAQAETAQAQSAQIQFAPADAWHVRNPGSDFMVDCIRELGYEYVAAIPGSTFRGLQESVVAVPGTKPEWITVTHEEISGAMAHGYYKSSGKPMALMVHNAVGTQHASMAVYDAWADRVPMLVITGNYADASQRNLGAEWYHSRIDDAAALRGMLKYDDQPGSLEHFGESMLRGHGLMMTPPMGPIFIVADQALQEDGFAQYPKMRKYVPTTPPVADPNAVAQIAKMLVAAKSPVIVADRSVRSQGDVDNLVKLAELLQAPVVDKLGRMNFPTNHYLWSLPGVIGSSDVILALDVGDLFGTVAEVPDIPHRHKISRIKDGTQVISIDSELLAAGGNYQDKQRFYQADLPVGGDAAATMPSLIEAVQRAMTDARRNENPQRAQRLRAAWIARRELDLKTATVGWDSVPISVPRMVMEVYNAIKRYDWALVSGSSFQGNWQQRLWDFKGQHQYIGSSGAAGVGYTCGASIGAALAHRNDGVVCVSIHGDGDFMMGPGFLWSAAHHKLPLLTVVHNNRAWHNETMFVQQVAGRRDRHPERGRIGTVLTEPNIDFAKVAQGFGVYAEGPITTPAQLGPAMQRAVAMVRSGHPALVDVVSQPR
ncbi:MAG TPA: thiamine pyrophosphate-dependent enzyme [Candidatus Acidoferrales bacterium]|nr:thiamine pyrophosphate-dependent enzyme [Candidatus Acidoferrales bacterium]